MPSQLTFAGAEYSAKGERTRRDRFLNVPRAAVRGTDLGNLAFGESVVPHA